MLKNWRKIGMATGSNFPSPDTVIITVWYDKNGLLNRNCMQELSLVTVYG